MTKQTLSTPREYKSGGFVEKVIAWFKELIWSHDEYSDDYLTSSMEVNTFYMYILLNYIPVYDCFYYKF